MITEFAGEVARNYARYRTETPSVTWVLGADTDVPALECLLGKERLDLVTIGQALHWMATGPLFAALSRLVRPGAGVAVIANGAPVWTHETAWAEALRTVCAKWFGALSFPTCGTSATEQQRYRELLARAGFAVREHRLDYVDRLTPGRVRGRTP